MASWYDYLEILPRDCLAFLLESGQVNSEEQLLSLNRRIYELGKKLGKPVCAVSDAHFLDPHQQVFRRILKGGIGFRDEYDAPFYLRTTQEMLDEFAYLGEEAAYEVVMDNPNAVAEQIEKVKPVPDKLLPPVLEGSEEETRRLSWEKVKRVYGDPVPEKIAQRLRAGAGRDHRQRLCRVVLHLAPAGEEVDGDGLSGGLPRLGGLLLRRLGDGHHRGQRAAARTTSAPSASTWSGTTTARPAPVSTCRVRTAPSCGTPLDRDGQDIPFETFLGFKGDKVPDIDLNFSGEVQGRIQKFSEELLGGRQVRLQGGHGGHHCREDGLRHGAGLAGGEQDHRRPGGAHRLPGRRAWPGSSAPPASTPAAWWWFPSAWRSRRSRRCSIPADDR